MNFKKIGEGHIFALSRDLVTWAKNSYFQNLLRITQYGSRLFGIDASSNPAKFQGDRPSGSPLIGAWSMTWHQLDKIVKNWHQAVKQCSTGNGFLTGNGNGNGNGKKCRERE